MIKRSCKLHLAVLSVNAGFYKDNDNEDTVFDKVDVTIFAIQPRVFAEFYLEEDSQFRPRIALGYTSMRFKLKNASSNFGAEVEQEETEKRGGFNFNLGTAFYFTSKLFALLQHDFIKLSNNSSIADSFFQNVNLLKIGVGFSF